jgi:hypothetical protein
MYHDNNDKKLRANNNNDEYQHDNDGWPMISLGQTYAVRWSFLPGVDRNVIKSRCPSHPPVVQQH